MHFLLLIAKQKIGSWEERFNDLKTKFIKIIFNESDANFEKFSFKLEYCLTQRLSGLEKFISYEGCEKKSKQFIKSLNHIWSFIDYELLSEAIKKVGDESLIADMNKYEDDIEIFFSNTTIEELIIGMKPRVSIDEVDKMKPCITKFNWDPKTTKLNNLKEIQDIIPNVIRQELVVIAFSVYKVHHSSVTVTWKFWTNSLDCLIKNAKEFFSKNPDFICDHKISSFILNDEVLILDNAFVSSIYISFTNYYINVACTITAENIL